jgi:hypothetical protein
MASKIQIANLALSVLGDVRLTSLTDDNETARKVNAIFDLKAEELTSLYPWSFAKYRRELALLPDAPLFKWRSAFQLPSDLIRLLEVNDQGFERIPHEINGDNLLMDSNTCKILYIRRITNVQDFPIYFVMALSAYLAFELCYAITQSSQMQDAAYKSFELKLASAKSIDAQSGGDYRKIRQNDILSTRGRDGFEGLSVGLH